MNAQATSFADFRSTLQQLGKNVTREDMSDDVVAVVKRVIDDVDAPV